MKIVMITIRNDEWAKLEAEAAGMHLRAEEVAWSGVDLIMNTLSDNEADHEFRLNILAAVMKRYHRRERPAWVMVSKRPPDGRGGS